jgi:hypothetical protein
MEKERQTSEPHFEWLNKRTLRLNVPTWVNMVPSHMLLGVGWWRPE